MTYYKFVRPDYTSFYDADFRWPIKGVVEVQDVEPDGLFGEGLYLSKSVKSALKFSKFPFRILKVKPLSKVLGEDKDRIRVARAESLGEIPAPEWAISFEKKLKQIQKDVKTIPWFKGTDSEKAKTLIRSHFELLVPFGFNFDFEIEILKSWTAAAAGDAARVRAAAWAAAEEVAAWAASGAGAGNAAWAAAWKAAEAAAEAAAGDAARVRRAAAWAAARVAMRGAAACVAEAAAWDAAEEAVAGYAVEEFATREAVGAAVWSAANDVAWDAARDLLKQKNPFEPLWKVYKLGFWPIGFNGKKFILFSEKADLKENGLR